MTAERGGVALVTGAASGIGAAVARLLADRVRTVCCADIAAFDAAAPGPTFRLDVRREDDWGRVMAAVAAHGPLTSLVHAAGVSTAAPLVDTPLDEWRRVLATNLDGTFLALTHGVRAMHGAGGAIVVIGSASGIRPSAGAAAYSTSKAAAAMLVRAAAKEYADHEPPIRISVVSPGGVRTPLWTTMPFFQELVRAHGSETAAFAALEAQGGGAFADPEDVAQAVLFLLSDQAAHITGVELAVDRGYTL